MTKWQVFKLTVRIYWRWFLLIVIAATVAATCATISLTELIHHQSMIHCAIEGVC